MAVFAFHNTHDLHQLSFFNGESTSSATPPPKRAVNSCGIENILEITDACGSGNPKSSGTAICATPMYRIKNLPVAATTKAIICAVCLCPQCRLPMKCQVNMRAMFPAMINGIRLQSVFSLLLFMVLISFLLLFNCHYSIICSNHLLHTQQKWRRGYERIDRRFETNKPVFRY